MSFSSSEMINKKMFHHRRTSKELEVFEAARYFSDYSETSAANSLGSKFNQKVKKKEKGWIKGRISLDMQVKNILNLPQHSYSVEKQEVTKEKKYYKQPSSPGGRLASFLNSLFSHSSSKKKKSKHFAQSSMEDTEDESRTSKRRISISHFRSSNAAATDAKFMYSSSPRNSGFRTPPPHVQTPTKSYKELLSFSKFNRRHVKSAVALQKPVIDDEKRTRKDHQGCCNLEEKQKMKNLNNNSCSSEKDRVWVEKLVADDQEMMKLRKKFDEDQIIDDDDDDNGGESDSSSDLFELQIYDLDYYSNGLPVYESTDIHTINRRNSVSNGVC